MLLSGERGHKRGGWAGLWAHVSRRAVLERSDANVGEALRWFDDEVPSERSAGPLLRYAGRDPRIVEQQAEFVVEELAFEAQGGGRVVVALPAASVVEPSVSLFESFHAEVEGADIRRWRIGCVADLQSEAVDRKGVRESRRLEIHVKAAVEVMCRLAVDPPTADAIGLQRQLVESRC